MEKLLIFGFGYTAKFVAEQLKQKGWSVAATVRNPKKFAEFAAANVMPFFFDGKTTLPASAFADVTHILSTIPPVGRIDPVLRHQYNLAKVTKNLRWLGYLSTTGVYGNHNGNWIDESTPATTQSDRSKIRLHCEQIWQAQNPSAHIFRLSGIYGPQRNAIDDLRADAARIIDKPDHFFNRIHVADIAQTLIASMHKPNSGAIYNLADDEPASSADVVTYAAKLLNMAPPPIIPFESAKLSPMAQSFYAESKRVRNTRIKQELGVKLLYPTYRQGLTALAR